MRRFENPAFRSMLAVASLTALLVGCGWFGDKEKKSAPPQKAPQALTVDLTPSQDGANISYKFTANVEGVSYKCQTEVDGQAADWQDCPADGVNIRQDMGKLIHFRVKAMKDGRESEVKSHTIIGIAKSPEDHNTDHDKVEPPSDEEIMAALSTVILNKSQIGQLWAQRTLAVNFGLAGGQAPQGVIQYECKRETDMAFSRCNSSAGYDFGQLRDGATYSLEVVAIHQDSGARAASDSVTFTVQLPRLIVEGEDALVNQEGNQQYYYLSFGQQMPIGTTYTCQLDDTRALTCQSPFTVDIQALQQGQHRLVIAAMDQDSLEIASKVINFCAGPCREEGVPAAPVVQSFLVGSFYRFTVPENLHVTEYATTKTFNRQLSFFRVLDDPLYLGNYSCDGIFDRRVEASTPSGQMLNYCHSTPTDNTYKWLTDYRLANNHIEVATDANIVAEAPHLHERIMINVFDRDYEYMRGRSRFESLCMNRTGTVLSTAPIRFVQGFFHLEDLSASFWMCDADLAGSGPGLPEHEGWRVGAFFISTVGTDLPDFNCNTGCGPWNNPNMLEVVYMARPNNSNWRPENFAQTAQRKFLQHLEAVVPLIQ
jgi:hypothetical protein